MKKRRIKICKLLLATSLAVSMTMGVGVAGNTQGTQRVLADTTDSDTTDAFVADNFVKTIKSMNNQESQNVVLGSSNSYVNKNVFDSRKSASKIVKYDLTGDKKAESIKFSVKRAYDEMESAKIYINGKKVASFANCGYYMNVNYVTVSSQKQFLWICVTGNNDDPEFEGLYKFDSKKKKLVKVHTFDSEKWNKGGFHMYIGKLTAGKNNIKVIYDGQIKAIGSSCFEFKYNYKNGKFVLDKNTTKIKRYKFTSSGRKVTNNKLTAKKNITFKKSAGSKVNLFILPKGKTATLLNVKIYNKTYYLQFQYGSKKGWISANKMNIFKNVELAG